MTISGSYGRDYKSAEAAIADWKAGKDFTIQSVVDGPGSQINLSDARKYGVGQVDIRYDGNRRKVIVPVTTN